MTEYKMNSTVKSPGTNNLHIQAPTIIKRKRRRKKYGSGKLLGLL